MNPSPVKYILKIKIDEDAPSFVKDYYTLYKDHHIGDSGIDLINPTTQTVSPNKISTINFHIKCEMIDMNGYNVSYYLYPRSSISKTELMMANSVGIIDAGYRGNIMAKVRAFVNTPIDAIIEKDKLFQICGPDLGPVKVEISEELSNTSRGEGGFGSTS